MKVSAIKKNPNNPRILRDEKFKKLCKSIKDFPQMMELRPIVVDEDGVILGGNMRFEALKANGLKEIPDAWVKRAGELTEEQKREFIVKDNVGFGDWDWDALANEWDSGKLTEWGLDLPDYQEVALEAKEEDEEQVAETISKAKELQEKWQTAPGQLWKLGEHRLLCGDSTKAEDVAQVIGDDLAEMVWTDPPYGVAVGDKNKFLNSIARSNRVEENLKNDTLDEAGLAIMLCGAFDRAIDHCTAGAAWYVAAPPGPLHVIFGQILKDRGIWRQTIQWVKNNATFSPMGVCYHWQAEPIFFGWLPNGAHRWHGGRTQTTVWNIDRPQKSAEHPTMKPLELVVRAVENSTLSGEVVYEPFAGSGTTILACEQLGRKCRAIELAPEYVAVGLQRWADYTGKTPELIDG